MRDLPRGDYALLSDCHSAALVSRTGSVDWHSFPRFHSPSILGRLLDSQAGHWFVQPQVSTVRADVTWKGHWPGNSLYYFCWYSGAARFNWNRPKRARTSTWGWLAPCAAPFDPLHARNFPQAFRHIGLINAAWAISEAEGLRRNMWNN